MKNFFTISLVLSISAVNIAFAADEIHWTITGQNSVTFDWRGTASENSIGYGLSSGAYTQVKAQSSNPVPTSSEGPFWEAKLTGLKENTLYYYSIGNGPERTFRTAPLPGSSDFTIFAQGNIGDTTNYFNMGIIQDLIANNQPAFVIGLGDLTLGSKNGKAAVDQHFNDIMTWSREAAYMPVWGDRDWQKSSTDSFKNYKGRFDVPNSQTSPGSPLAGGEDWYWFDYGNARFITVPEPWLGAWSAWKTQADTLMAKAQTDPNIKFIVTFAHQPAYSSGLYSGSDTLKGILDNLGDTYNKYVLNVNAHSINYERSYTQHGVVHVTAGTGGENFQQNGSCLGLTCSQPSWSAFRALHQGALKLHFTNSGIEGAFICGPAGGGINDISCTQGSIIDNFTIDPPITDKVGSSASKTLVSAAAGSVATCTQTALNASSISNESGYAYIIRGSFGASADNSNASSQSTLRLFENGIEVGPAHSTHADIRTLGKGRFSHWSATDGSGEAIRFSASDNTNPKTNGKSYTYCTTTGTTTDTQAPTVPSGLTASASSSSQINLSWSASSDNVGVSGYRVFRNGAQVGTSISTSYADSGLAGSTSYTYTVAAYDAAGNSSGNSTAVTAKTSGSNTTNDEWAIQGFAAAAGVTGGSGGTSIVVTNLNTSGAGSLAAAIATSGRRVITFTPGLKGTINFTNVVYIPYDDITIDGTGADITISGYSLSVFKPSETPVKNVIIKNLTFENTVSDRNAVNIEYGSYNVWVDHCTFRNNSVGTTGQGISVWDRGLGYGTSGQPSLTGITISWNKFEAVNKKSMLIGATDDNTKLSTRVSLHHNWLDGVSARNPRISASTVHMWNNYISNWSEVGTAISGAGDLLVENNIYEHSGGTAVDADYANTPANSVNATGNLLLSSPLPVIETRGTFPRSVITYTPTLEIADDKLKQRLIEGAGVH